MYNFKLLTLTLFAISVFISCNDEDPTITPPAEKTKTEVSTYATVSEAGAGGLTIDQNGILYSGDFGPQGGGGTNIHKIDTGRSVSLFATGFSTCTGNTVDLNGIVYQSSFHGHVVQRVSSSGLVEDFITEGLMNPTALVFDSDGSIYVANFSNNTILKRTVQGEVSTIRPTGIINPNGMTIDENDNLYITNWRNSNIIKVTADSSYIFAELPLAVAQISHVLYHENMLYAVARSDHKIFSISMEGEVMHIAGTGNPGFNNDELLTSSFNFPNAIAISPNGKYLYVNEIGSGTLSTSIRQIDLNALN